MDRRANTPPEIVATGLHEGIGIALDLAGGRMFFTDLGGSVYSARLDGTEKRILFAQQGTLTGIAYAAIPQAAVQSPPPSPARYEVKRAPSRIQVDGKLDEKAWETAGIFTLIFPWESQTGAKQKTTVRLLWDDQNLYIGYACEDADITAQYSERDDPTYRDDAVEAFINPRPSQTDVYFGLEMNARGVLYDYVSVKSAQYVLKRFNMQGVQLATFLDGTLNARGDRDRGWNLEVAIPWANFEELSRRPEQGAVWTATFNRWDGVEPDRRLSMWVDPQDRRPSPHHPEKFGELIFAK